MEKRNAIKLNLADRVVNYFHPSAMGHRIKSRVAMGLLEDSGYIVPGSRRKTMKGVNVSAGSPDRDTAPKMKPARAFSRDMFMNTPLMVSALRRFRTNVVGAGLQLQPTLDRKYLGLTEEQATAWEATAIREFDLWASKPTADFSGQLNFYEMQALSLLSVLMNGDLFFMLPWKATKSSASPYELRVKLIEADLVRNPDEYAPPSTISVNGKDLVGGVEKGPDGEVEAYWLANYYSTDFYNTDKHTIKPVPLYDANGRRNMYHLVDIERVGQRRGMPLLAPVFERLKQISRLSDSTLMAALVSSLFTVFVKDMSGMGGKIQEGFVPEDMANGGGGYGPDAPQQPKELDSAFDLDMGNGNVLMLDDDKEIQVADPRRTDGSFAPFYKALVTEVSAAIEMPREVLLQAFEASYSASRAALLEVWKVYRVRRTWLSRGFCQPTYEEFITEATLMGRMVCPGFFDDPAIKAAWCRANWVGAGQGQLDPLKEAKASVVKIAAGLSTHEDEFQADTGGRWGEAMDRLARENKKLADLGIKVETPTDQGIGPDGGQVDPQDNGDGTNDNNDDAAPANNQNGVGNV